MLLWLGCSSNTNEAAPAASGATCPNDSMLTYENFGRSFVQAYCLRCHSETTRPEARHGAPSDTNFDMANQIRSHAEHIDAWAAAGPSAVNTLMPPSAPAPSEEERHSLGEWLACGAL